MAVVVALSGSPEAYAAEHRNEAECGITSLYCFLRLCNVDASVNEIRQRVPVRAKGSSLADLKSYCDSIGFPTQIVRGSAADALDGLALPAIVHLSLDSREGHFSVLTSAQGTLHLIDGGTQLNTEIERGDFLRIWSGYAMQASPSLLNRIADRGLPLLALALLAAAVYLRNRLARGGYMRTRPDGTSAATRVWSAALFGGLLAIALFLFYNGSTNFQCNAVSPDGAAGKRPAAMMNADVLPGQVLAESHLPISRSESILTLARLSSRMVPLRSSREVQRQRIHLLLHSLRLWGAKAEFIVPGALNGREMVSILLNASEYASFCPGGGPLIVDGDRGFAVYVGDSFDAASHTDKLLAVLAEAGVPLGEKVTTRGRRGTVSDILDEALMRFEIDQSELEWTTVAFAAYLSPARSWVNRFGEEFSFDALARALLARKPGVGPCYGVHVLYALAYLARVDEAKEILSPGVRVCVIDKLKATSRHLAEAQFRTGCWTPDWYRDVPPGRRRRTPPQLALKNILRCTGHHLEWIAIAPRRLRPNIACISSASRFVCRELLSLDQQSIDKDYSPYSHAVRSILLLHNVDGAALLRSGAKFARQSSPCND